VTNDSKVQLLAERVRALATIVLTRRADLSIVETKKDTGLDFHVYVEREDKPMRLMFGVLLRGVASPVTVDDANKVLGPTMGQFRGMRKFSIRSACSFSTCVKSRHSFPGWPSRSLAAPCPS
jgi:hypothetical protein